ENVGRAFQARRGDPERVALHLHDDVTATLKGSPYQALHSSRSAINGSTRLARNAGTRLAPAAIVTRSAATAANVSASVGLVPKSIEPSSRVPASARPMPTTTPSPASRNPWP